MADAAGGGDGDGSSLRNPKGQPAVVLLWIAKGPVSGTSEAGSWNCKEEQCPGVVQMYPYPGVVASSFGSLKYLVPIVS